MSGSESAAPSDAVLVVENPGLWTTVQDLGRPGHRAWGVPVAGAFDRGAHALANALVGNLPRAATLELTLVGGAYRAEVPLALALAGAVLATSVTRADGSSEALTIPQSFTLRPGDRLLFGPAATGARTYLAVAGGWLSRSVLGSRSGPPLQAGDRLPARPGTTPVRRPAFQPGRPPGPLRVVATHDGGPLPVGCRVGARSNRMGLQLEGPGLEISGDPERVSAPVAPGAIQVAGGQPIVLGPDCGTMGGYPVVAHVITADLDLLAQLRPGDAIDFLPVPLDEARRLDRDQRQIQAAWVLRTATLSGGPCGN